MKTEVLKINKRNPEKDKLKTVRSVLENDGVVVIPTDTVYGLASSLYSKNATDRIYKIKGRSFDKPLIVMLKSVKEFEKLACLNRTAKKLIKKHWPGPLTLVANLKKSKKKYFSRDDIGARIPDNNVVRELLKICSFPIMTTSANPSFKKSAKNGKDALKYMKGKVEVVIDSGACQEGFESTVVSTANGRLKILRQGCLELTEN